MLTTLIAFLIVLGILIFIHELGHFLAARHVGVRVEAFSVGFPPTLWGKKIGDTAVSYTHLTLPTILLV